jgi:DNA-binding MarR family transcriptional regulator
MPKRKKFVLEDRTKRLLSIMTENRIKILAALYTSQNIECGTDLVKMTGMQKSLLTYHIKFLEDFDFIEEVKCGKFKNYKISQKKEAVVKNILKVLEVKI